MGLHETHVKVHDKQRSLRLKIKSKLRLRNLTIRQFLAEFLGTFLLVVFGCGSLAQMTLSKGASGEFLSVNLAFGWGVAMGAWVSGGVSGGHMNPAVTLAVAILGRMRWAKVPVYWLAQYLGAFIAAACVFGIYYDAIEEFDGGNRTIYGEFATAGIFGTYPQSYISILSGFGDQVFGTMLLVLCIMALTDKFNMAPDKGVLPLAIGGALTAIGLSYGLNCGYAINPARDFGPRAFTACFYGVEVFTAYDYWFWVPLVAPHVGAVAGAWFYMLFVGIHTEEIEIRPGSIDDKDSHDGSQHGKHIDKHHGAQHGVHHDTQHGNQHGVHTDTHHGTQHGVHNDNHHGNPHGAHHDTHHGAQHGAHYDNHLFNKDVELPPDYDKF